ncbi:YfhD family protein [Bacillus taeanensis]|uniref:YfhD family protein n=1 Tax=Bacillus taeanensis TaxID=273032 RepID=A0A366Y3U7_9BACI|nr:YfhD family protein [Bacillus taeanensis]RBW71083.1 YfhD family protein [Bacillus taeanensis]
MTKRKEITQTANKEEPLVSVYDEEYSEELADADDKEAQKRAQDAHRQAINHK